MIGTALGIAIGGALFGPVLGGIASVAGPGPAFGAVAVFAVAIAVGRGRTPSPPPTRGAQPLSALCRALRDPRLLPRSGSSSCPALLFGTLGVLAPLRLDELGFGALAIGATWLVAAALEAIAAPLDRAILRPARPHRAAAARALRRRGVAGLPWPGRAAVLAALVVVAPGMAFGSFWTPAMSAALGRGRGARARLRLRLRADQHRVGARAAIGAAGGGALAELTLGRRPTST